MGREGREQSTVGCLGRVLGSAPARDSWPGRPDSGGGDGLCPPNFRILFAFRFFTTPFAVFTGEGFAPRVLWALTMAHQLLS